jgi:hypothetical protein
LIINKELPLIVYYNPYNSSYHIAGWKAFEKFDKKEDYIPVLYTSSFPLANIAKSNLNNLSN